MSQPNGHKKEGREKEQNIQYVMPTNTTETKPTVYILRTGIVSTITAFVVNLFLKYYIYI